MALAPCTLSVSGSGGLACLQERRAREATESNYGSYKQQISWGVHVLVMMATLYAVGHVAGGALNPNPAYVPPPPPPPPPLLPF